MEGTFASSLPSTPRNGKSLTKLEGLLTPPDSPTEIRSGHVPNAWSDQKTSLKGTRDEFDGSLSLDDERSHETQEPSQGRRWVPDANTIVVATPGLPQSRPEKAKYLPAKSKILQTRKNFSWQRVHLESLCLLRTRMRGSWDQTAEIFNEVFQRHIRDQGLSKGPNKKAIQKCYSDRTDERHAQWREVMEETKKDPYAFDLLKLEIEYNIGDRDAGISEHLPRTKAKPKVVYNEVPKEKAHPPVPSILFRSYCDQSQGLNSSQGFTASYFRDFERIPLPPACSNFALFPIIRSHMNLEHFQSPLVSTSGSFARTVRRSVEDRRRAMSLESCRISIIDAKVAGEGYRIFWAKPYKLELERKRNAFDRNKWKYKGSNEYLVWGGIPAHAIIHDISLGELLQFCDGDPVLSYSLDVDLAAGITWDNLRKRLYDRKVYLSPDLIAGMARLVSFLGLRFNSSPCLIARLVSEIIQGWCVILQNQSAESWIADAVVFVHTLNELQSTQPEHPDQHWRDLCGAFLSGLRTSVRHWWSHFENSPDHVAKIKRQAAILGLMPQRESDRDEVSWSNERANTLDVEE